MTGPTYHAPTHSPDGTDPVRTTSWAYYSCGPQTITSPTASQNYPINMTVFGTNDEGTFGLYAGSGAFAGFNGPGVLRPGVYWSTHSFRFAGATVGDVLGCHYGANGFAIMPRTAMAGWTTVHYQAAASADDPLEQNNTLRFQLLHFAWGPFDPTKLTTIPGGMIETAYSLGGNTFTVEECQVFFERLESTRYVTPASGLP